MSVTFPALPPPFTEAPHIVEARGFGRAWVASPSALVHQVAEGAVMDVALARWITGPASDALRAHARATGATRLRFVHDWRGVVRHETDTRRILIEWGLSFARGEIERIDALLPPTMSPILGMAVSAGRLAMTAAGIRMEIVSDPEQALAGLSLR